jgi:hypothetical protein
MGKYERLGEFLRKQATDQVPITFDQIEKITGAVLPRSAQLYRAWWSNNARNSVMTKILLATGFRTEQVDIQHRKLVFRRVRARIAADSGERQRTAAARHPLFGWLKGTARVAPGVDLTEPADPEWANSLEK